MLYLRISRRREREFNAEQQASVTIPRHISMASSQQSYFIVAQLVVVASSQQSYVCISLLWIWACWCRDCLLWTIGLFISLSTHPLHLPSSVDKQRVCSQVILHLQLYNNYHSKYDNERPRDSEAEHFFPSYFQSVSSQRWKWPLMMTSNHQKWMTTGRPCLHACPAPGATYWQWMMVSPGDHKLETHKPRANHLDRVC